MKVVRIPDEHKDAAVEILQECVIEQFDSVIVFGFHTDSRAFKIKASKIHDRLYILGALAEAMDHTLKRG